MSGPPTLLIKGKLNVTKYMDKDIKANINDTVPLEYITNFIGDRMNMARDVFPKIKPMSMGDKIIVIKSGTGSGKSTLITPELFRKYYEKTHRTLLCTQPSIINSVSIPHTIVKYYPELIMGKTIGYRTSSQNRKIRSGVIFATIGILLQQLKTLPDEEIINMYSVIAIDEVHLRSLETDTTLYYLKLFLTRNWNNPNCPTVLFMSATFDETVFMKYFDIPKTHYIEVSGVTYPVEVNFNSVDPGNWMQWIINKVEDEHVKRIDEIKNGHRFRDFLVFVSTANEIDRVATALRAFNSKILTQEWDTVKEFTAKLDTVNGNKFGGVGKDDADADADAENDASRKSPYIHIIELSADTYALGGSDYKALYSSWNILRTPIHKLDANGKPTPDVLRYVTPGRRIIVGTNALETGVTIDTLGVVFNSGMLFNVEFNPTYGAKCMFEKNSTKSSVAQRKGRVGRLGPGAVFNAFSEETYEKFDALPPPNILTEETTLGLLPIIIGEVGTEIVNGQHSGFQYQKNQFDQNWYTIVHKSRFDGKKLDFIQSPSADGLAYGMQKLHKLGLINSQFLPTLFGLYANKFRMIDIECARMILAGYHHGANIMDLITIASVMHFSHKVHTQRVPKVRNPLQVSNEVANNYYKYVFCDDLLEHVWLFDEYMMLFENITARLKNTKSKSSKAENGKKSIADIPIWCKQNQVNIEYMNKWIESRDDLIESMLNIGLNPYYNGLQLERGMYNLPKLLREDLHTGIGEVRKLKHCILEGYRCNCLVWDDKKSSYTMLNGAPVNVDSVLIKPLNAGEQLRPKYLITPEIKLFRNFSTGLFEFKASELSVMDGYVDIDLLL